MRKPDGQGKLNVPASTGKSRTPSRQRSQSTDTPTPTPHTAIPPLDFGSSLNSNTPPVPTGLMRLQEKMAKKDIAQTPELSQAAVRRKSVLPKSGRGAEVTGSNLEPTMARLAIRTSYVASETVVTKGVGLISGQLRFNTDDRFADGGCRERPLVAISGNRKYGDNLLPPPPGPALHQCIAGS